MTTPLDLHSIESRALRVIAQAKDLGATVPMADDLVALVGEVRRLRASGNVTVVDFDIAAVRHERDICFSQKNALTRRTLAAEEERDVLEAEVKRFKELYDIFQIDVSPIIKACALLARESWKCEEHEDRDHWRQTCVDARSCADSLANELARLRELEVKWVRALAREQALQTLLDEFVNEHEWPLSTMEKMDAFVDFAALDAPVTEADLERFRKGK